MEAIEVLRTLVNPWTILLIIGMFIYRTEVSARIMGADLELTWKDFKFSSKITDAIIRGYEQTVRQLPDDKTRLPEIRSGLDGERLGALVKMYGMANSIVLDSRSRYRSALETLADIGLVEINPKNTLSCGSAQLSEYALTEAGISIRDIAVGSPPFDSMPIRQV